MIKNFTKIHCFRWKTQEKIHSCNSLQLLENWLILVEKNILAQKQKFYINNKYLEKHNSSNRKILEIVLENSSEDLQITYFT